jgi:polyhydroxyalkanoate synthase
VFALIDEARRLAGRAFDTAGLGPIETPFRIVTEEPGARVRAHHAPEAMEGPVLLIVSAPFKRSYVWDLLPDVSVVRRCLRRGMRVYLLEWLIPGADEDRLGLEAYADHFPSATLDAIEAETGRAKAVLAGHSLGGTLAAIFAALRPDNVQGLVLVDAPLAFADKGGPLARAVAILPHAHVLRAAAGNPVPGSFINLLSLSAAPEIFVGQRWSDAGTSLFDPDALAIHARVERWALDEFPLPGRLFEEILELLYREDRFRRGTLEVNGRRAGLNRLRAPILAVVNPLGGIVPPESILTALAGIPDVPVTVLEFEGDRGPMLQHLGPLVTRLAHERLWPRILDWISSLSSA